MAETLWRNGSITWQQFDSTAVSFQVESYSDRKERQKEQGDRLSCSAFVYFKKCCPPLVISPLYFLFVFSTFRFFVSPTLHWLSPPCLPLSAQSSASPGLQFCLLFSIGLSFCSLCVFPPSGNI